jgi:hypothetical protein
MRDCFGHKPKSEKKKSKIPTIPSLSLALKAFLA